jgi:hypothetical protein
VAENQSVIPKNCPAAMSRSIRPAGCRNGDERSAGVSMPRADSGPRMADG